MMRTLLFSTLLFAAGCGGTKLLPARGAEGSEPGPVVVVHSDLHGAITVVHHNAQRLASGQLQVRVVVVSSADTDLAVLAHADFTDVNGLNIEQSTSRPLVLPPAKKVVFEETSFSPRATAFQVSLRPASTDRE